MRNDIIRFVHELEMQNEAAFNLWTWLPSYKEAEKHHGDYACEFTPSVSDIIKEASMFISDGLVANTGKHGDWYSCPCGEDHS